MPIDAPFVQYDSPNHDVLYTPTKAIDVDDIQSQKIQAIISEMKTKMTGKGIGLAANQLGYPLQLFMIEFTQDKKNPNYTKRYQINLPDVPYQVFINPIITKVSDEKVSFWHGCLSALDKDKGLIATYKWIEYQAYDEHGILKKGRLDDMAAVIFQHEFRHLLGSLYFDHAKEFKASEDLNKAFQDKSMKPYQTAAPSTPLLLNDYKVGERIS